MEEKRLEQTEVFRAVDGLCELNKKMILHLEEQGKHSSDRGGYFVLSNDIIPPARFFRTVSRIGEMSDEDTYRLYAQEKASRMLINHRDHATSWQSRDVENHKFGGAVRVSFSGIKLILSFSGYPEHCDEALMIALAVKMDWLEEEAALRLASTPESVECLLDLLES